MSGTPSRWESWVNRTTAILAVFAAISSGQWGASNLRAILEQGKVNDGWSYYQSKSVKWHLVRETGALAAALATDVAPGREGALVAFRTSMAEEEQRLRAEKDAVEADVKAYERSRDMCVERSFWFEMAFAALQVSVVLSMLALASGKKGLWVAALALALSGAVLASNAYLRFFKTPAYAQKLAPDLAPKLPAPAAGEAPPAGK